MKDSTYYASNMFFTGDVHGVDFGMVHDKTRRNRVEKHGRLLRADFVIGISYRGCDALALLDEKYDGAGVSYEVTKEIKFDLSFLNIAKIWAQNSRAERKKVGCLIVRDNSIIADGYNGTPSGFDNKCEDENGETKWEVLHAEANAITKLARSSLSSDGATLYTTLSPCRDCSKIMMQAGIKRLVYTDEHSDTSGLKLLAAAGVEISRYFPPNVLVVHGVGKGECPKITPDNS